MKPREVLVQLKLLELELGKSLSDNYLNNELLIVFTKLKIEFEKKLNELEERNGV